MGAGHSHDVDHSGIAGVVASRAKLVLTVFLGIVGLATAIGMAVLWPSASAIDEVTEQVSFAADGVTFEDARITAIDAACPSQEGLGEGQQQQACINVEFMVLTGLDAGRTQTLEIVGPNAQSGLEVGDELTVARVPSETGVLYSFFGIDRMPIVWVMLGIFVVATLAVARWRGLRALIGLVIAILVLFWFMLPALAIGTSGIAAGLVGSVAIMFVVLYIAHGVSYRTSAALAGTLIGLTISIGLGVLAVWFGRLSGMTDEAELSLAMNLPDMDFRQLLIAAMIVAGLGVLNDVTITQSSAVYELRAAAPEMSRWQVFVSGMRIGSDHIASTIYTIVFAYAGGALAVLVLTFLFDRPLVELIGTEQFGTEVLRTLASATGLVLSVPITTAIAALTLTPATARSARDEVEHSAHATDDALEHNQDSSDEAS